MTLFDSAMHPTLTGEWLNGRQGITFQDAQEILKQGELTGACSIGLPGVGGYEHEKYFAAASQISGLVPVAALTSRNPIDWEAEIQFIHALGYRAIKFHPRLLGLNDRPDVLSSLINICVRHNLVLFYCTYYLTPSHSLPGQDPLWFIVRALKSYPEAPIVLMHGGAHRVLEYAETFRYCPNVLLDLSLTLTRFGHSSIRQDITHIVRTLDQRICLGSDAPDVPWGRWFSAVDELKDQTDSSRWTRIASENIKVLLGV